ncbi:hypothetical protein ABZ281_25475, partial [Streptomyces sp. NPDC006265]
MTDNAVAPDDQLAPRTPLTLLGTGAMGTALARVWLAAGHEVTGMVATLCEADTHPVRRPSQPAVAASPNPSQPAVTAPPNPSQPAVTALRSTSQLTAAASPPLTARPPP